MHKHVWTVPLIIGLFGFSRSIQAQRIPFTVKDSIEMSHFNEPNELSLDRPNWNVSPDGTLTIVITTKGVVESNVLESTLSVIDMHAVVESLREDQGNKPKPKPILKTYGELRAFEVSGYGSLLTKCTWSADSKAVYLLMEQKGGWRQLYKVDVTTGLKEAISPEGYNVTDFDLDSHGLLYSAEEGAGNPNEPQPSTPEVIENARDISLFQLLWPSRFPKTWLFRADKNGNRPIAPGNGYHTADRLFFMSPDGTKVIALEPVDAPPASWSAYITPLNGSGSLVQPKGSMYPTLEYEVIDLENGTRRPLLGSPSGRTKYDDLAKVVWSSTGDHVLVTNTFLPLGVQDVKQRAARRYPCAVADVEINDGSARCIVFTRTSKEGGFTNYWRVLNTSFGPTDHEVVLYLRSWLANKHKAECYSQHEDGWSLDPDGACANLTGRSDKRLESFVRIFVVQGPDTPPSLWAEDLRSSRRFQIWDPNPQLATKVSGTTSMYHWTDKNKHEWSGLLTLPEKSPQGVRLPLVIQTHGFQPKYFMSTGLFPTAMAARPLAAAGFAVLQMEKNDDNYGTLEELHTNVEGVIAAIDALAASNVIDPTRVGIVGFSRTGWHVEEALIDYPDRFAAAVIADATDPSYMQFLMMRPNLESSEAEHQYRIAPFGVGLQAWEKLAPGFRLSAVRTPLRIQAITPSSLLGEWETYASLRIQNKAVDLLYLPKGQHNLLNPAEVMASEQGDVDWFRFWLNDEEDHDPAKCDQYVRWEHLRGTAVK